MLSSESRAETPGQSLPGKGIGIKTHINTSAPGPESSSLDVIYGNGGEILKAAR